MKVMVGIDESDESFYALQWAIDKLFRNEFAIAADVELEPASLTLLHVRQPSKHYGGAAAPTGTAFPAGPGVAANYPSIPVVESERNMHQQISARILSRALEMCGDKVNVETQILEGDPKDKICEASEKMGIDLLILGSRGLGMIQRAFLGSVSDYCAHYAKCPVLIVKPPKETTK
ncbi:Universal stress protein A [Corchorus capsularis]|uniref:Universal stress protein A n=1 Tax=Corchorus capsularis TaxID=210143 RepID=A0A1R3G1B6_COCAP|nr:Universal stress protein A [Corchorus capsularis]